MAQDYRTGRAEAWRTLAQRGVDTAAELSDVLAQKLGAAADPRAKILRKRRWAFRAGLFFTFSTGLWVVVTAVLAAKGIVLVSRGLDVPFGVLHVLWLDLIVVLPAAGVLALVLLGRRPGARAARLAAMAACR